MSSQSKLPLVVFGDDWGRHPSSGQHLVRQWLPRLDVTWVDTIGMRPVRFDRQTLSRGLEKLSHWRPSFLSSRMETAHEGSPRLLQPAMWPSFGTGWSRRLNQRLLARCLNRRVPRVESATVFSMIPIVAGLRRHVPARQWIYYCVDDYSQWPGLDSRTMLALEEAFIQEADAVVAVSEVLADRVRTLGREPLLLTHGVDLDHWRRPSCPASLPSVLVAAESPRVLFWGLLDRRLDRRWLERLSERMRHGSIVLVGPQQEMDSAIGTIPRVVLTGRVAYEQLPHIAAAADVLVMPYADLPVTRAMQPLKLLEYLATDRPVVVRDLPAVVPWRDALDAASTAEGFVERVLERIETGLPELQRLARQRLEPESWRAKAESLLPMLERGEAPPPANKERACSTR